MTDAERLDERSERLRQERDVARAESAAYELDLRAALGLVLFGIRPTDAYTAIGGAVLRYIPDAADDERGEGVLPKDHPRSIEYTDKLARERVAGQQAVARLAELDTLLDATRGLRETSAEVVERLIRERGEAIERERATRNALQGLHLDMDNAGCPGTNRPIEERVSLLWCERDAIRVGRDEAVAELAQYKRERDALQGIVGWSRAPSPAEALIYERGGFVPTDASATEWATPHGGGGADGMLLPSDMRPTAPYERCTQCGASEPATCVCIIRTRPKAYAALESVPTLKAEQARSDAPTNRAALLQEAFRLAERVAVLLEQSGSPDLAAGFRALAEVQRLRAEVIRLRAGVRK